MYRLVRRSNLVVAPTVSKDWNYVTGLGSDAITLDIRCASQDVLEMASIDWIPAAARVANRGGSEFFVGVEVCQIDENLQALMIPGVSGVVQWGVESSTEIVRLSEILTTIESDWRIPRDSLQIIPLLGTALAVWNVRNIIRSSSRILQEVLDELALCRDLEIMPHVEYDPLVYARGRIVIEATALNIQPVGAPHPLGTLTRDLSKGQILELGVRAKNLGLKGALFYDPLWVEPLNEAFSPTEQQVEYYREVREVFAEGIGRGTAAVPLRGRMVDVPVDEWAKDVLERSDQCMARDQQKRQATQKA